MSDAHEMIPVGTPVYCLICRPNGKPGLYERTVLGHRIGRDHPLGETTFITVQSAVDSEKTEETGFFGEIETQEGDICIMMASGMIVDMESPNIKRDLERVKRQNYSRKVVKNIRVMRSLDSPDSDPYFLVITDIQDVNYRWMGTESESINKGEDHPAIAFAGTSQQIVENFIPAMLHRIDTRQLMLDLGDDAKASFRDFMEKRIQQYEDLTPDSMNDIGINAAGWHTEELKCLGKDALKALYTAPFAYKHGPVMSSITFKTDRDLGRFTHIMVNLQNVRKKRNPERSWVGLAEPDSVGQMLNGGVPLWISVKHLS